jgi:chloride channel protein, CIC family
MWLLRMRLRLSALLQAEVYSTMFWAIAIGIAGALSSLAFRAGISACKLLLTGHKGDFVAIAFGLPWWWRWLVPAIGGLAAGVVLSVGARVLRARSSTDYMEAIVLGDGMMGARPTLVKSLSALLSIASGASIGREGPMVQLAAMLGSLAARVRSLPLPRRRLLVACGAAAGIASAYNAPISGALFVAEIVLGSIAMQSLGPLILSSVAASLTLRYVVGDAPIFQVTGFRLVSLWELGAYAVLGVCAGVAGPWFLHLLRAAERGFSKLAAPLWVRTALGGLAVGAISIAVPDVWGNGTSVVNAMLHSDWTWSAVALVAIGKIAATAAAVGSGAVGGVFTPTLFTGAALGSLLGIPLHRLWPQGTASPQAYALVGMGCFLAATTHAPLMAIMMVFEMTLDYSIVIPLTLACVIAYFTAYAIERDSIYSRSLAGKHHETALAEITVLDVMKPEPWKVFENASFAEVTSHFARSQQEFLFVVSADGVYRGAIPLRAMEPWLRDPDLQPWAIASDIVQQVVPVVTPTMTVQQLLERFAHHRGNRVAVVDAEGAGGRLVGSVSKTDLMLSLAHGVGAGSGDTEPRA